MSTQNVRINYEVDKKQLDDANKSLKDFNKTNEVSQKEVEETNEKLEDSSKGAGKLNKAFTGLGGQLTALGNRFTIAGKGAGDLAASMFAVTNATKGTSKAMRVLKVAIASTGIGLLIVALGSLTAAFKSSETGQNKFAKLMDTIGVIVGNVSDIFANIGEKIIEAFENPQKTIKGFVNLVKTNVVNRFVGLIELVPKLGKAIDQVFSGDFVGAARTAGDAVVKVTLGVEDFSQKAVDGFGAATEAVKEFTAQTQKEVAQAQALADKRAATDILERQFLVDTARLESQVADLRLKGRQEDAFTANERLAFLNEANELQNKLIETELTIARNRAEEQTISNTFSKSTKENLDEEARLNAAVFQVEAKRLNQQRTLQREINTASKQAQAALDQELKAKEQLAEIEAVAQEEIEASIEEDLDLLDEQIQEELTREVEREEVKKQLAIDTSNAKVSAADQTLSGLIQIAGQESIAGKAAATAQAGINIAQGITAALSVAPPPFNLALAAITGAAGAIQLAKIAGAPTFEAGGPIGGKRHSEGGTLIEAEKGEYVINRKAVAKYGDGLLNMINGMELDPEMMANISNPIIINQNNDDVVRAIKSRPENRINVDGHGFTQYQMRQNQMIIKKQNRYSV